MRHFKEWRSGANRVNATTLQHWFEEQVLRRDTRDLPWPKRLGVFVARMVYAVVRDIIQGQLTLRATSLVYTTLLSLVPLLAVSFSVLKAFGVHNQVEPALEGALAPLGPQAEQITARVVEFVDNMQVGVLGGIGLAMLFYTVVALIQKIEGAFNATWRVALGRPMAQRFSDYLSVVLIGPVLVFTSLGITASVFGSELVRNLSEVGGLGWLVIVAARLVPYLLIIAAFTCVYLFVPNTRVRPLSALVGALVAGVLWQTSGWVFASFVAGSAQYTAIYSAFATLVVFMIWLYVSWLILLVGASVAYYHQHPRQLLVFDDDARLSARMLEYTGLSVMAITAGHFYERRQPVSAERIAHDLTLPVDAVAQATEALVCAGLLRPVAGAEDAGYQPATPPDATTLGEVIDALRHHGEQGLLRPDGFQPPASVRAIGAEIDRTGQPAVRERTVRDLVPDYHDKPELEPAREGGHGTQRRAQGAQ